MQFFTDHDNGNRLNDGSLAQDAVYDAQDRLTSCGSVSFTYTSNGELRTRNRTVSGQTELTSYTYDVLGNLRSVTLPGAIAIDCLVDSAGRSIGKKVGGVLKKKWLYRSALQIAAEIDDSGVLSRFGHSGGRNVPDFMIRGGGGAYRTESSPTTSAAYGWWSTRKLAPSFNGWSTTYSAR